jgi:hypothetical protein
MSQKVGFFRRIFHCPSNPEVSTISDESDDDRPSPSPGKPRFRKKNRRQRDDRFRSATNISENRRYPVSRNRLSASENHLAGSNDFRVRTETSRRLGELLGLLEQGLRALLGLPTFRPLGILYPLA